MPWLPPPRPEDHCAEGLKGRNPRSGYRRPGVARWSATATSPGGDEALWSAALPRARARAVAMVGTVRTRRSVGEKC